MMWPREAPRSLGPLPTAERLGGQNDIRTLVAGIRDRPAGDLLRKPLRVDVGRVDEVDAGVERAGDDAVGIGLVERAYRGPEAAPPAEGHGAKTDLRDREVRCRRGSCIALGCPIRGAEGRMSALIWNAVAAA